jgi:site-specific recombinase XerD
MVASRARPRRHVARPSRQERQAERAPRRRGASVAGAAPAVTYSAFVFVTERGGPFTPDAVNRLIKRIGERAGLAFPVHAHMLRHACGYALANAGHDTRRIQDWLGHRSIAHTVRYTELSPTRFRDLAPTSLRWSRAESELHHRVSLVPGEA